MGVTSTLSETIRDAQTAIIESNRFREEGVKGQVDLREKDSRELMTRYGRIWVPSAGEGRKEVLETAHKSKYSIHSGSTKMYRDLKRDYWWPGMKREIERYVQNCLTCLQVKVEHQMSYGKLQPLEIPTEVGQREVGSTDIILRTTDKIEQIQEWLQITQDRKKSYADNRRRAIQFQVGDRVLLKVSPWKGVIRFRKRGKLGPRYIGPFKIVARVGKVAYKLSLSEELSAIHDTFHVSQLRKCLVDENAFIPLPDIIVDDKLRCIEELVRVLDQKVKQLRNKEITL
ncbi:uncharacterized protein [Rutidosis leptorrhynchoides]|uniref:uncharacterized protein n=1 Tax=Rutidosis leptorrhynchoides TaxID=125765 RepID=UPI003A99BB0E